MVANNFISDPTWGDDPISLSFLNALKSPLSYTLKTQKPHSSDATITCDYDIYIYKLVERNPNIIHHHSRIFLGEVPSRNHTNPTRVFPLRVVPIIAVRVDGLELDVCKVSRWRTA